MGAGNGCRLYGLSRVSRKTGNCSDTECEQHLRPGFDAPASSGSHYLAILSLLYLAYREIHHCWPEENLGRVAPNFRSASLERVEEQYVASLFIYLYPSMLYRFDPSLYNLSQASRRCHFKTLPRISLNPDVQTIELQSVLCLFRRSIRVFDTTLMGLCAVQARLPSSSFKLQVAAPI